MTIKDVFIRFSLTYVALVITVFLISAILKYVGASIPSLGIFILIMSTFCACEAFAKKNKRYFTKEEEKQVIIGFFIINLIAEGILSALGALAGTLRGTALLIAIGLVVIINPIIIYIFVGLAKINLKKRGIIVE